MLCKEVRYTHTIRPCQVMGANTWDGRWWGCVGRWTGTVDEGVGPAWTVRGTGLVDEGVGPAWPVRGTGLVDEGVGAA